VRSPATWSAWPKDPNSFTPNWRIYEVVFDMPRNRRLTVLWNGDGTALRARVPRHATQAQLLDMQGNAVDGPSSIGQDWSISLPPATAHFSGDPPGYYFIGGEPRLLIEEGVPAQTPAEAPRL
jgi:hypothetical protein